jgi:hypothetical protein
MTYIIDDGKTVSAKVTKTYKNLDEGDVLHFEPSDAKIYTGIPKNRLALRWILWESETDDKEWMEEFLGAAGDLANELDVTGAEQAAQLLILLLSLDEDDQLGEGRPPTWEFTNNRLQEMTRDTGEWRWNHAIGGDHWWSDYHYRQYWRVTGPTQDIPIPSTPLQIKLDKIHCVEESGADWAGSDEIFLFVTMYDGKNPLVRVRVPNTRYYSMDTGSTRNVNRTIYNEAEVGPYIQIDVEVFDDEYSDSPPSYPPPSSDQRIGTGQLKFGRHQNWGKGQQHKLRIGNSNAMDDIYFTIT